MATGRREKARKPITIAIKGDATVGAATRLKATLQQALQSNLPYRMNFRKTSRSFSGEKGFTIQPLAPAARPSCFFAS